MHQFFTNFSVQNPSQNQYFSGTYSLFHESGKRTKSYTYNANGFLPLSVDYSFMLQANWLKFGMLMCFDMGKDNTEPENGKNP